MDDFDTEFTSPTEKMNEHMAVMHETHREDLLGALGAVNVVPEQPLLPVRSATEVSYRFEGGTLQETSVRPT